jgi:predicted  nucleic acid-binding Zn ribbon protein
MSEKPLSKLKAAPPTPEDELCACSGPRVWKLMYALGPNPIHCADCNLEVPPDELQLSEKLVEAIASWRNVWGSIFRLWLNSGAYEEWARAELVALTSPANRQGLALVEQLAGVNPCFFQYFEDQSAEEWTPLESCPSCGKPPSAQISGQFAYSACEECSVLFWREVAAAV